MAASANGHQLGWWLGRAGSCLEPAGLAAPPLPPPGTVPHQPQVSQAARGGREAWLGFRVEQAASLSGPCFLQAPSQMQGRLKRGRLTAPGLPITLITSLSNNACTLWAITAPGPLHWLCPCLVHFH